MEEMARALAAIDGVAGVTLGGSQARGTADAHSDVDLGVYYRGDLDVPAVRALARAADPHSEVTERGGWGPWVDGGAWLTVDGTRVDRAAGCLSQARHAQAREWVTTEKGTVAPDLAAALAHIGTSPAELHAAIDRLRAAG